MNEVFFKILKKSSQRQKNKTIPYIKAKLILIEKKKWRTSKPTNKKQKQKYIFSSSANMQFTILEQFLKGVSSKNLLERWLLPHFVVFWVSDFKFWLHAYFLISLTKSCVNQGICVDLLLLTRPDFSKCRDKNHYRKVH